MAEKPILFSSEMVRAILDGRKTQTRRVIKNKKTGGAWVGNFQMIDRLLQDGKVVSPYGIPGDRLWVREAWTEISWTPLKPSEMPETTNVIYRATPPRDGWNINGVSWEKAWKWRPSISMPRWASRIILQVKDVWVERLQDISIADVLQEGIKPVRDGYGFVDDMATFHDFELLWDSVNEKRGYSLASNLWVWVVEFELER